MTEELYRKGSLEDNLDTRQTRIQEAYVLDILLGRFGIAWSLAGKLERRSFASSMYGTDSMSKTRKSQAFPISMILSKPSSAPLTVIVDD